MYNVQKPNLDDLPSTGRLLRSTVIAAGAAALLLVTVVMPAEYGVDPTGVGRLLGLAEMGEIRTQLAEEAEADRQRDAAGGGQAAEEVSILERALGLLAAPAHAHEPDEATVLSPWRDEIKITLEPDQGTEVKLKMEKDGVVQFYWTATGGVVNFDLHGDAEGESISYEKGRAVAEKTGTLTAAFTGNHGWFWRNRGDAPVEISLRVVGDYTEVVRYD